MNQGLAVIPRSSNGNRCSCFCNSPKKNTKNISHFLYKEDYSDFFKCMSNEVFVCLFVCLFVF